MNRMPIGGLLFAIACSSWAGPAAEVTEVFSCSFRNEMAKEWTMIGGNWKVQDDCLKQTHPNPPDPTKAIVIIRNQAEAEGDLIVTAKLRMDSPKGDDLRAGISVCTDPANGRGLSLVFHHGKLQCLHDFVTWGAGCDFPYETGQWYRMKLYRKARERTGTPWIDSGEEPAEIKGKVWKEGEKEPSNWMVTWHAYDGSAAGYAGLNGGALVSFAEFKVEKMAGAVSRRQRERSELNLNGTWQVRLEPMACLGETGLEKVRQAREGWLPAQVPGEIHLDLVNAGLMPEPTVGANISRCRWPETNSWWYRTDFDLTDEFRQHERQRLVFDALETHAQVFVNGHLAGESVDAFVPAVFDVKRFLQIGPNELVVRLTTVQEHFSKFLIRACATSYGWDWIEPLPNIGLSRGVRLEGRSHVVLHDIRLDTVRQNGGVSLEMEAVLENLHGQSERAGVFELEIHPPDGGPAITRRYPVDVPPGRVPVRDRIEIPHAKLWWPNGMGDQPLYHVVARVRAPGQSAICDGRELTVGLRTIELDRKRLANGSRFCFRVNGQDVFCRGGNVGSFDPIRARVSDAKYQTIVADAKNAHMTMFRVNGVSVYERPSFYEACDRAGILIWHDFMMASLYPEENEPFVALVRAETESAIRRLRHHPSIALWCGNNEMTPQCNRPGVGQKFYNQIFPDLCMQLDPRRPYWPGSPCGGIDPWGCELSGDTHGWYNGFKIPPQVFKPESRAHFVSEYGFLGPCHLDSIRQYLAPEEMKPEHPAWQIHQQDWEKRGNNWQNGVVPTGIRLNYIDTDRLSVPDYVLYGQMFQAIIHGYALEALRFRKNDPKDECQGALIWSYTDCWGESPGWSLLDYYLRRKASYYWFRRACAPVKVIVRPSEGQFITRLVNDTLQPVTGAVEFGWCRLDGSRKEVASRPVAIEANSMLEVAATKAPTAGQRDPRQWLYAAVLRGKDGIAKDQSVWLLEPYRKLAMMQPQIRVAQVSDRWLAVSSPVFAHAVHAEDHGREMISDNWFDLLPGVPVRIRVAPGCAPESIRLDAVMPN